MRDGTERAELSAEFDFSGNQAVQWYLGEAGLEGDPDVVILANLDQPGEHFGIAAFQLISPLKFGPARRYRAIDAADVARAMASAAWLQKSGSHVYLFDDIQRMAAPSR